MPLAILRSPLPVKEWVGFDQEEADRHYSLGYRDGLRDGLNRAFLEAPAGVPIIWLVRIIKHVEDTGRLPGEEAEGG